MTPGNGGLLAAAAELAHSSEEEQFTVDSPSKRRRTHSKPNQMKPKEMERLRNHKDVSGGVEKLPVPLENPSDVDDVTDFVYVRYNIPGPDYYEKELEAQFAGCDCVDMDSCNETCPCIQRFGVSYDNKGHLMNVDPFRPHMKPVMECNRECKCRETCTNRVVQKGLKWNLQIFRTEQKGFGLRTKEPLPKDIFVCEYAGEMLTEEMARVRAKAMRELDHNYILAIREHLTVPGQENKPLVTFIDPTFIGSVGRFLNHSCDPNLYMIPCRVDNNIPRAALFALRDIEADEELTYDYSGDISGGSFSEVTPDLIVNDKEVLEIADASEELDMKSRKESKNKEVKVKRKKCLCGSEKCKGMLPHDSSLYPDKSTVPSAASWKPKKQKHV